MPFSQVFFLLYSFSCSFIRIIIISVQFLHFLLLLVQATDTDAVVDGVLVDDNGIDRRKNKTFFFYQFSLTQN